MKAVILAGGYGTRLAEETGDAAISVQERMNPGQPMVSGRGGDDALVQSRALSHGDRRVAFGIFPGGTAAIAAFRCIA